MTDHTVSSATGQSSTGWRQARRVVSSVLVVVATAYLGLLVGEYFSGLIKRSDVHAILGVPVKWGLAGVALTYVLASLERVLKVASTFREYITQPDKKVSLYPDCVALACIIAYCTVLVRVGVEDPSAVRQALTSPKELVYLERIPQASGMPVDYFPYLFDLAKGPSDWSVGTTLSRFQEADLERLVGSLKACVGTESGEDVEIDVRGYADTNEFSSNTDELNRQTANRRSRGVHDLLQRLIGSQAGQARLVLRAHTEWPEQDPKAMTRERYFTTKPLKITGVAKDQGLFNRRADVLVLRLGVCERLKAK